MSVVVRIKIFSGVSCAQRWSTGDRVNSAGSSGTVFFSPDFVLRDTMHDTDNQSRTDDLCKRMKANGNSPRWGTIETYNLIHLVGAMSVKDDSEIVWRDVVSSPPWDLWSGHDIGRCWLRIKRSVEGHETLPFSGRKYRRFHSANISAHDSYIVKRSRGYCGRSMPHLHLERNSEMGIGCCQPVEGSNPRT